jgi:hypothetical protein
MMAHSGGDYALCAAKSIADRDLIRFAAAIWPEDADREARILRSWWRNAAPECAVAAVHQPTRTMVGICCARPCDWVIAGKIHPAVSICDWYVDPGHEGKLLGRRMLRRFEVPGRFLNAISISHVAVAYLNRLGWVGPYKSCLMMMPFPGFGRIWHLTVRRGSGLDLEEHTIASRQALGALGADLDRIEAARATTGLAHMRRSADDWSWRLSIYADRLYRFCVARRGGEPVGYVVVRPMAGTSRSLGRLKAALITDLVAIGDDREVLQALAMKAVFLAAEMRVALALYVTTSGAHRRALAAIGYLSPGLPMLGRLLQRRAPVFMWSPRGPGKELTPDGIEMTFADSTIDLDL